MCPESTIPTTSAQTPGITGRLRTLFTDFRGQLSWGRVCAAVALTVAVIGQFKAVPMDAAHLEIWLGVALGNYTASKLTEMVCGRAK